MNRRRPGKPLSFSHAGSAAVSLRRSQTRAELEERWRRKRIARRIRQALAAVVALAGLAAVSALWLTAEDEAPPYEVIYRFGEGRSVAPEGLFVDVSVWELQSCGVRVWGELVCWGDDFGVLPSGLFEHVAVAAGGGCALRRDGTVACWRGRGSNQPEPWEGPLVGELLDMQAGPASDVMGCGVRADHTLVCWGENVWFRRDMPEGRFVRMAGTGRNRQWCALAVGGEVACWGDWYEHPASASVPEGLRFSDAWLGWGYGCGIELGGATACWDTLSLEQMEPAALLDSGRAHLSGLPLPDAGLARLARGSAGCAIDTDGQLRGHCGRGLHRDPDNVRDIAPPFVAPPSGRFTAVALSGGHGCGLLAEGTLACWGYPYDTETEVTAFDWGYPYDTETEETASE